MDWHVIFMFLSLCMLALGLSGAVFIITLMLSQKHESDSEKLSPFECGFSPLLNKALNFSVQFFLVSLIFLIFDVELILLYPVLLTMENFYSIFTQFLYLVFVIALSVGFIYEWMTNQLEWYSY